NRFIRALVAHERGHRNAGVHAAVAVHEAISRNLAAGKCDGGNDELERIIDGYGRIDDEYDRHTDHGANEGVHLHLEEWERGRGVLIGSGGMVAPGGQVKVGSAPSASSGEKRAAHRWKFFRAGGVDQVLLRDGRDIVRLAELDQKLWVALAMPTRGV